jgi:hypothetical protein
MEYHNRRESYKGTKVEKGAEMEPILSFSN